MKINAILKNQNFIKHLKYTAAVTSAIAGVTVATANNHTQCFSSSQRSTISPKGSNITDTLRAPNSNINIAGNNVTASIVVDTDKNILYLYNKFGVPQKAYLVASGKDSSPTTNGIRKIIKIEKYPYKSAPKVTKRYNHPRAYGPFVLVLCPIDTTNDQTLVNDGQFIHGTNDSLSLGHHASLGCIRMDNEAIKDIANYVEQGQYVNFIH